MRYHRYATNGCHRFCDSVDRIPQLPYHLTTDWDFSAKVPMRIKFGNTKHLENASIWKMHQNGKHIKMVKKKKRKKTKNFAMGAKILLKNFHSSLLCLPILSHPPPYSTWQTSRLSLSQSFWVLFFFFFFFSSHVVGKSACHDFFIFCFYLSWLLDPSLVRHYFDAFTVAWPFERRRNPQNTFTFLLNFRIL